MASKLSPPTVPTLYHVPPYCSSIPTQIITHLNIPSTKIAINKITKQDLFTSPTVSQISPRRVVPVLHFPDGSSIVEGGAIILHLLESFDKKGKLHPLPGAPKRPKFLQGILFAFAEAHSACLRYVHACVKYEDGQHRLLEPHERDEEVVEQRMRTFEKVVVAHFERELDRFYLGHQLSAVDFCFAWVFSTVQFVGYAFSDRVREWLERVKALDSYQKVYEAVEA